MNTTEIEKRPDHFDVSKAIDKGHLTNLQRWTYVLASLAIIIDGFDGQMIGYAIPQIMNEWGTTRAAFSLAVASGLAGMAIGSLSAGVLADKFGRNGDLWISDWRMGQYPNFFFTFNIGPPLSAGQTPPVASQERRTMAVGAGLVWLGTRMRGTDVDPPRGP